MKIKSQDAWNMTNFWYQKWRLSIKASHIAIAPEYYCRAAVIAQANYVMYLAQEGIAE